MKRLAVTLAASAAMFAAGVAPAVAQDGPRVFTRTGSWALDAADDSCQLARVFTNGEDQIALALERNRADNFVRVILVSNALRPYRSAEAMGYRFMPANDQRSAMYIRSETPDGQTYFNLGTVFIGPDPFAAMAAGAGGAGSGPPTPPAEGFVIPPYNRAAELEFAAGITAIEFNEGLNQAVRLETGSLRGPIEALQTCADDLIGTWGLDWQKHQTMTRRAAPVGPAFEWIPSGVIGFGDFANLSGARNPFRVMVGVDGSVTGCHVHWSSLTERQNAQICEGIMANGRFTPALDADGQPMASYWMTEFFPGLSRPFGG